MEGGLCLRKGYLFWWRASVWLLLLAVEEARSKVKGTETGAQKKDIESTTLK